MELLLRAKTYKWACEYLHLQALFLCAIARHEAETCLAQRLQCIAQQFVNDAAQQAAYGVE